MYADMSSDKVKLIIMRRTLKLLMAWHSFIVGGIGALRQMNYPSLHYFSFIIAFGMLLAAVFDYCKYRYPKCPWLQHEHKFGALTTLGYAVWLALVGTLFIKLDWHVTILYAGFWLFAISFAATLAVGDDPQ